MTLVALLLGLDRRAVLAEQWLDQPTIGEPQDQAHQPVGNSDRQKRDLQRLEIEQEESARIALVDRQHE